MNLACRRIIALLIAVALTTGVPVVGDTLGQRDDHQNKTIYLTFDDGPSNKVTTKILNILKEKGVKGTFFIVGCKIEGREQVLKKIVNEGHAIGLHSYTHNYKKIYGDSKQLINEMNLTQKEIRQVTGKSYNVIRFPAGSSPHLNASLLNKLHARGYKIYDWNASLSDGLDYKISPDRLVEEATKVFGRKSRVILLMHCDDVNVNTCRALPEIIDHYRKLGYEFKTITEDTKEYYFRFD